MVDYDQRDLLHITEENFTNCRNVAESSELILLAAYSRHNASQQPETLTYRELHSAEQMSSNPTLLQLA
jgi:hypothetical protein